MKQKGFNISKTNDPVFVRLPRSSEYTFLIEEIYENVLHGKYRF